MAISRDINNLVINKVESQQVYDYMVQNNLINDDELYLIQGENEGIIQPDWNQNDETAPDYVKNRTHWIDSDTTTINWDGDFESEGLITAYGGTSGLHLNYVKVSDSTPSLNEICNNGVVVMCMDLDGSEYPFDLTQNNFIETESGYISSFLAVAYVDNYIDSIEGFSITFPKTGLYLMHMVSGSSSMHAKSLSWTNETIHPLDEKFLPESVTAQPDWNQNDETAPDYIKNRTHYSRTLIDIEWDGDITGLNTHNIAGYDLYNVADVTGIDFSEDNYLKGSMIASMSNSTQIEPFECDLIIDEFGAYPIGPGDVLAGYIIPNETVAEAAGFPSAGLYLWKLEHSTYAMYVNSLTIENNKKIDEKYIPFKLNNLVDGSGEYSIETADQEAKALGTNSAAMGYGTLVYGDYSHAEGYGSIGMGSVTLSGDANATTYSLSSANSAIEVGKILNYNNNYAKIIACSPDNLTITLDRTLSSEALLNEYVTRVEYDTVVSGDYSHAEGKGVLVFSDAQHVQGKYNISDADNIYAHIVGNGVYDNNRSNAHTLDWSGNAWFAGDVYVGSTSGTNKDEGSVKLATTNDIVQPDWNQNDETAPDYVKNRPFYYDEEILGKTLELAEVVTMAAEGYQFAIADISGNAWGSDDITHPYIVEFDGVEYECYYYNNGVLGNVTIIGESPVEGKPNNEPFCITVNGSFKMLVTAEAGTHSLYIKHVKQNITQIDEKFIPDSIARVDDLNTQLATKQNTLTGTQGQVIGFDEDGNAVAEDEYRVIQGVFVNSGDISQGVDFDNAEHLNEVLAYYGNAYVSGNDSAFFKIKMMISSSNYMKPQHVYLDLERFEISEELQGACLRFRGIVDSNTDMIVTIVMGDDFGYVSHTYELIKTSSMPEVTSIDNGKFLRVVNGAWAATTVPNAEEVAF